MAKRKRRLKPRWKVIIPFFIILVLIVVLLVFLVKMLIGWIAGGSDKRNSLYCPSGSVKTVEKLLKQNYPQTETIGDTFFYGESLIVTSDIYNSINKANAYNRKTVKLINICSKKEYTFTLNEKFDEYILVDTLPVGIYEVYLQINEQDVRLKAEDKIANKLYTVSSGNSVNLVEVIADKEYFTKISAESVLSDNYLFVSVTKTMLPNDVYDIVIDPEFNDKDDDTESNEVYVDDKEAELLLDMANLVAEELRSKGYKVLVTRDGLDDHMLSYGENGRVYRTVSAQAKYYIGLTLSNSVDEKARGAQIAHSYYSSDKLADALYQTLLEKKLTFKQKPVNATRTSTDYDNVIDIREIGGIALQAASFSSFAQKENGKFAYTVNGVNGVSVNLGYLSNKEDIDALNQEYKTWAKALATGLDNYIKR